MSVYLGIDVGTSGTKTLAVREDGKILASATVEYPLSSPRPGWSEQNPEDWIKATDAAVAELRSRRSKEFASVKAIGLSGQMHGATMLGRGDKVLRPAILWNDGRSGEECAELEKRIPTSRKITGNLAMPGFTAPKVLWTAKHEPQIFSQIEKVLLPKDYLRLRITGDYASEMSDAAGTLWLDVGRRAWSDDMVAATGLKASAMPKLYEGSQATGVLRKETAAAWGLPDGVIVAGGAGDNAAGAAGMGVVRPGEAFLSLGTSGVYFVSAAEYSANPESAVHTFCHCLPGVWHQMSVILSAASCLSWAVQATGAKDEVALLAEAEACKPGEDVPIFLPYLSGERTPHNNPLAKGAFFGITHGTTRGAMGRAVLEGVAFAFRDGQHALQGAKADIKEVSVIGGGARSALWGEILASVLRRPLLYRKGGELGPAFGAARLALLAQSGAAPETVCTAPAIDHTVEPNADWAEYYNKKIATYRALYQDLKPHFAAMV